jgi:hypothetical protein
MKRNLCVYIPVLAALLLSVSACKKAATSQPGTAQATFNGQTYTYIVSSGVVNYNSYFNLAGYVSPTANNNISINLINLTSGVHPLNQANNLASPTTAVDSNSISIILNNNTYCSAYNRSASVGTMSITNTDNKITGTFSGSFYYTNLNNIVTDSIVVTNGSFSAVY